MDDVAAMIKSIEEMISQISDKVKGNPHIQALNKVLKGPLGYLKKLLLMMVLSLFAATLGPIVDNAKDKVEKVKKLKKIIEKIIKLIKQIVKVVKAILKAVVKIIKPILQLYFTFPSPACWVAWAVTIITVIIVFLGILLGRFGSFAGEFVMDFDKMQEMNQVEEDYTDLLNTGALKEAFYESIADTSFYQTFNLSDMEGSNISWADRLVAGVASLVTGQEYTSEDILAQQKCVAGQTSCIYSSGGLMDMFTWAGISVPNLDPRYQITDASKNPAKYLIQAEGLGTYSDALGMTSYFRDYWNREEQFSLDKDFLYELNRWLYETDAYPTTEQIVYPEAFVQPVSFVDDFLRIQSDKTVDGFGDPYVYVTQRVTLEDIQDLDSEYYNKYEYEGLIKTTPSDIVYDYVVKGTNSYEIIQQSASANQVNIGNPADYATVKKVITYEDGSTEVTYVAMKAYWIVNPIFKDQHMGLDVTFEDYTSYIDPNDDRIGDPTGYYYRETPGGALKSIDITTEAYIGPFLDMSVEGNKIVFNTKINLKKTDAGKITNNDYTKLREYIYQQYNPNIANSAFVTFEDGTYAFVNCVVDYSKSTKLVDKNGNELTKQKLYGKEAIFYEGTYYYFDASASSSMEIDSLSIGSLKKATGLVVFPRVIDYNQYKNTTIYPGELVVYSSSKKAYQYNGTTTRTLTTSTTNCSRVRSFNTYNLLPTRHYQLAQLADSEGHIVASSRNLINKTYLKTKTVRPYFRNSDEYWLRFEEFTLEDMDRAGYVGVFTDALGIEMQGQCIIKKDEDENFYNLHYCEEADEDKCVAEPEEWDQKKCSVVRYVNQMYPGQDVVAKLSNLFMGDEAEFAELPMSAQSIYTILTLYEDYLIATGTEGVEWEYKYYSNSKMEAAQAAAEMAPSFSFFGIRIPDPFGLASYFESDKRKYEDTFDKVVELNESRAISSEYTPIGVVSGTTPVVKKVNCPSCGRNLGYVSTSTASCWWCGSVPTGIADNKSNVWGWKIDKEVGGTVYIKKVYGESSLEFPDYYDDADTLAQGISSRFDEILNYLGTFDHRMKLASFLFTSDYAENRYGAVNFAYKWVDNGSGGYKLTYDEAALKDFYTCLFLNSTNLPDRVGEDNDTEDNKYQDIRNDEQAWRDDVTVWRPVETAEMEGIMVEGTTDGRGIGRVTTQTDPDDYLALELKSVRDYGLASVLSYLESRKVTFFTGIALTETYQIDGVYAWMYSYYMNNNTFEYIANQKEQKEMAMHEARMATSGFYPSSLLRDDITTMLIVCPHCTSDLDSSRRCTNNNCSQFGTRFNKAYKLNDFVRSTEVVQEGGSILNQDKTVEGLSVGDIFLPSDLANIADGLNELQGTGESIFKYKNSNDNTWYWFTVTYAIGVNDTNTEWNDDTKIADEISDLFMESQGYIVMMKKCKDENNDGKISEIESRKTQWIKTNINVAIPYISEYGLQNLYVDKIIERYASPLTQELIKYYSNADARKEVNNQFFNPKGHYLAWYDYSTGNLDLGDMVGSLISQKHLINEYDNNTAAQLRRLFNIYESCDDCYCSNANTQIECECGVDVYVDERKNNAADDDQDKDKPDDFCDICGEKLDLVPSGKAQLHHNEKPDKNGDGSFGHTVKDLNGDLICDYTYPNGKVCKQNVCPCTCHSIYVSFENVSDIKTTFWSSNKFMSWISKQFNIGNLFNDAGKYISNTAYEKFYNTYFEQVNAIDLLDDTRTSKVFMIEEAVTFLGNFLYSYDTKMIIAGDVYGDEKIVSDLVFADRGYVISNYIFAVPAHTTYVQWTSQTPETNYIYGYPEGSNDGIYNTDEVWTNDAILRKIYSKNPCVQPEKEATFWQSVINVAVSVGNAIGEAVETFVGDTLKVYDTTDPIEAIENPNGFNAKYCASNYYYSEHMVYDFEQKYVYQLGSKEEFDDLAGCTWASEREVRKNGAIEIDTSLGGTKEGQKIKCSVDNNNTIEYYTQYVYLYGLNEETDKIELLRYDYYETTTPQYIDTSKNGTIAGYKLSAIYNYTDYRYKEEVTTYKESSIKYTGTKEGGVENHGHESGRYGTTYYHPSTITYNKDLSYLMYTWEWKTGATYKVNKLTSTNGTIHEKYSKLVYIDTYNEVTQIYQALKDGVDSVPLKPDDPDNSEMSTNSYATALKIFIGMKVMDNYSNGTWFPDVPDGKINFFASYPENVRDFVEDAVHWYTVQNSYKICQAEITDPKTGFHYICNTVNDIDATKCSSCKLSGYFDDTIHGAVKICPICQTTNDPTNKKCSNKSCGVNIKKITLSYTQDQSHENYDDTMYDEWCFGQSQPTKCRSLAWGDTEDHYTVYSQAILTKNQTYLSEKAASALMSAAGWFTNKVDIKGNLDGRFGLLLGNGRLSNGNLTENTWWLSSGGHYFKTTYDGYSHKQYNTIVDSNGNLDDDAITYAMTTNDWSVIDSSTFELTANDLANIMQAITQVYGKDYDAHGFVELGGKEFVDSDGRAIVLNQAVWHEHAKPSNFTGNYVGVGIAHKRHWNTKTRGTLAIGSSAGTILTGDEIDENDLSIDDIQSTACSVDFYWMAWDYNKDGVTNGSLVTNESSAGDYMYGRTVYRRHYLTNDWRALLVGIEAGDKGKYGTPIALETTLYGNYKQITPVQTSMFFNEEVYKNWRERMNPDSGDVNSVVKEQYLLSYRNATSTYLYDYLTNFETYLPLSVKSDADLVNRGADAYRSIQANDQRALAFTGSFIGNIKKNLGTTGWVTIIENYNQKSPSLSSIVSALIPATVSNDLDADILAEYIAGLIETTVEYAPEWTIEYYNYQISEENKAISASNEGKAEADKTPLKPLIERSFDNYAAIEDTLYYSLFATSTKMDPSNMKEYRTVTLYHEDGTKDDYNMLYLGAGAILAREFKSISTTNVANDINGFGSQSLTIGTQSGKDIDERLDMEKSLSYVTIKFGKLLYKYGNVSSATMAYFYGEDYWDEMLMVAKTNGISTGPEWHNDDYELIEEVIARKLGNANADHSLFAVLDYDEEVIENIYTAQVVDYALSFVQDSQDRLFLIRNTSTSLGKAVQSIGSNAEKTKQFLELLQEGDLDVFIGHKYSEDALFTIDYSDIQELARKFNVDLGVVMAVMMGESDGDPCYGLGTCRIQDEDYIITQLIGSNVTERRVGLFGIPYNAQNSNYSTDYTVSKVDYKQACLATPYNNLNQNNDNAVYAPDALASNKSFAYGITSSYKTITNISMNANGEFVVKYDDFTSANLGKIEVKPGFYKGYNSTKQGWVDTDGNLLYTLTDSKLDQNGNLVLTYTYSNPDADGVYAVVEENLGSVHLISQANNKCTVKTYTSFATLPTTEAIKSYIYDPYLSVLNVENIAQTAEVKPNSYYADQYETILAEATNFVNNDGRFAYEGRIALFYVLSELAEIYEQQEEDALATIFVYYYGEAEFNKIKAAAISKGYGNNWYTYYCTTVNDAYNKVMKALSYYDATLEEENTFDIKDTLSEYVNGDKSEKTETSKYYDKAYGRYVTESKKYIKCESTATGKCTKTYNKIDSFTATSTTGGKCDTATATSKFAGRDNLVINSVTQTGSTSTYDRSYSFTYKEVSLDTCNAAYDYYVAQIAASGASTNTLPSKNSVCKSSDMKNKNTYSVAVDFSKYYEEEFVWDGFLWGHTETNEEELARMCGLSADSSLHSMTFNDLVANPHVDINDSISRYWNSSTKKCTVSYTVTQNPGDIGLSGIWFKLYDTSSVFEKMFTMGTDEFLRQYGDYKVFTSTETWFGSSEITASAPSTVTIIPSVTIGFTTVNETRGSLITAYGSGLDSQTRTTTNTKTTYTCSANYTYTQTSDVSDKESCKVGEANVIDAVFTFDDPNYSQGKYRCDVERTRTIDYANNWNLTINGFSVMAFSLFDDMSSYNEVTADKLAKQNSGIEVYIKEGGNTRTDVDSIITATLATEDNFIITADSYSLFAFFEQVDEYLDDSARSWFSPIGLDEDDVGAGTTNKYVKSKIWDFPVLMRWSNTPVGSNNITIVEQFGEENNILAGGVKHNDGITIKAKRGTVIRPVFDGIITAAGYNNIYGNYVEVQSNSLSAINPMIISTTEGERYQITGIKAIYGYLAGEERGGIVWNTQYSNPPVTTSTTIGYAGLTGQTTGEQLYFALYVQCNVLDENDEVVETIGWTAVDPEPYFTTFFNVDYQ